MQNEILKNLYTLWRRTKIGGYYVSKRINHALNSAQETQWYTILGYDPHIRVAFPDHNTVKRIQNVRPEELAGQTPLLICHGFLNCGRSYANYKNADRFKRPIFSFDYPEVASLRNINLGEDHDTCALLYVLHEISKINPDKKLDILAHSRGAGTALRALYATLHPEKHNELFKSIGIHVDTQQGFEQVQSIKLMLAGRNIMLAYPMLNAHTAIKHVSDQLQYVVKPRGFISQTSNSGNPRAWEDIINTQLQASTNFTGADVQPIDLLQDILKEHTFSLGFAFATKDDIVSNNHDAQVKKLIELYPVNQNAGAYLITDQGQDHDDLAAVFNIVANK